ncbi:MAG: hypothetical protein HND42_05165 [Armatimonadetes bacterium]|nr:hypothetical protein [Armatimonadota bacterium]NOG92615.1 hypothetical protein [Armatimonadota bacterium]
MSTFSPCRSIAGIAAFALANDVNAGNYNYYLAQCDFLAVVKIIGNAGEYSYGPPDNRTYVCRVDAEVVLMLYGNRTRTSVQLVGYDSDSPNGQFNTGFTPGELRLCAGREPDANLKVQTLTERIVRLENEDQVYVPSPSPVTEYWNFIRLPSADYTIMGETKVEKWAGVLFQAMATTRSTSLFYNLGWVEPDFRQKPPPANPWEYEFVGHRYSDKQDGPTYGAFFGREILPMMLRAFEDDPVMRLWFLSAAIGRENAHLIDQWRRELLAFSRSDPQPNVVRELRFGRLDPEFQKPLLASPSASVRWACIVAVQKPDWRLVKRLVDDPVPDVRLQAIEWFERNFKSAGAPERNYTREGVWTNESEVRAFWRSFRGDG